MSIGYSIKRFIFVFLLFRIFPRITSAPTASAPRESCSPAHGMGSARPSQSVSTPLSGSDRFRVGRRLLQRRPEETTGYRRQLFAVLCDSSVQLRNREDDRPG